MTIQADRLQQLLEKHGNIEVCADCPECGASFPCGVVALGPPCVRLQGAKR